VSGSETQGACLGKRKHTLRSSRESLIVHHALEDSKRQAAADICQRFGIRILQMLIYVLRSAAHAGRGKCTSAVGLGSRARSCPNQEAGARTSDGDTAAVSRWTAVEDRADCCGGISGIMAKEGLVLIVLYEARSVMHIVE